MNGKQILRETLFAILSAVIGLVVVSLFTHNWNFLDLIKSFKLSYIIWAFVFMFISWLLEAYSIKLIGDMLDYEISFAQALKVFLIGGFFSRITPFDGGGGEPFQMVILSRENAIPAGDSVAIISIKTFVGSFVRVGIFILAILWVFIAKPDWGLSTGANILVNVGLMITLALFVLLLITIMKPEFAEFLAKRILNSKFLSKLLSQNARQKALDWVGKTVKEFSSAKDKVFSEFKRNKVYFTFALSFISWGFVLFTPFVLMRGLGVISPWPQVLITTIIFYISSAYFPTPGGSGTAEIEIFALFTRLIPNPLIGTFIIVWRFFTHYFILLIGGITTVFNSLKKRSKPKE